MKLSKLVYECVRDSVQLSNNNFTYVSFVNGDFDTSQDYKRQIANVFGCMNLAISRLYDYDKIQYSTKEVEVSNNQFDFEDGEVKNVVEVYPYGFKRFDFRTINQGKTIIVFSEKELPSTLLVEYRGNIPHFESEDIKHIELDDDNKLIVVDDNIPLEDYGITDNMCSYIKEFVAAQLTEYIDPTMSNNHNNRAEQYLDSLKNASTSFYQSNIKTIKRGML